MQEYINEFTRLQQEVDYHRENISPLTKPYFSTITRRRLEDVSTIDRFSH